MAKKTMLRPQAQEDVHTLKTLRRERATMRVIARKLKRSLGATSQKALRLGLTRGAGRGKKRAA
jgi:hypothetical protein